MKKVLITMGLMALFFIVGSGFVEIIFSKILGGGVDQSFIYPIYGGIIVLTGIIVGATAIILDRIDELEKMINDKNS